jgi:hypothetical protein
MTAQACKLNINIQGGSGLLGMDCGVILALVGVLSSNKFGHSYNIRFCD